MKIYHVIMLRPLWFVGLMEDVNKVQDLQYVAIVEAEDSFAAGAAGKVELRKSDIREWKNHQLLPSDYTVLGVLVDGVYSPWLNGDFQ